MRSPSRRAALTTAALMGAAAGVVVTMALTTPDAPERASGAEPDSTTPTTPAPTTTSRLDRPDVLLVWTSGGVPAGLAEHIDTFPSVDRVALVRGDETAMTASFDAQGEPVDQVPSGWHIPLDALAVDPSSYATFLAGDAADQVRDLDPGQALLTEASARLRRLGTGATVHVGDAQLTVAGVIDDHSGAAAELLLTIADAALAHVDTARFLLVGHDGERDLLQLAIAEALDGRAVRFRSPNETTWLRHGDAVEPPAVLKARYGEFAIRPRAGRTVDIDPAWVERWIVTEEVPILRRVTCHRRAIEPLRSAMAELEQTSMAHLVDASAFAGRYAPRRIAAGQPLSHHAWGAAVDLNVNGNPRGSFSTQDPRLVDTMSRHGFTWGGTWLVPDPAHYEAPVPQV